LPFWAYASTDYYYYKNKKIFLEKVPNAVSFKHGITRNIVIPAKIIKKIKNYSGDFALFNNLKSTEIEILKKSGNVFPAYSFKNQGNIYVGNTLFISPKLQGNNLKKWLQNNNLKFVSKVPFSKNTYLVKTSRNPVEKSRELFELGKVKFAEPNFIVFIKHQEKYIPNDPFVNKEWFLEGTNSVNAMSAWQELINAGKTAGKNVKLAVIDDGFEVNHPDLKPNVINYKNFGNKIPDSSPIYNPGNHVCEAYKGTEDCHGTSCAGAAGGRFDNNEGIAGVCPMCQLILIRYASPGTIYDVIYSFQYAFEQGAQVISNSWGLNIPRNTALDNTFKWAKKAGIVILFASGNNNQQLTETEFASSPYLLAVGEINKQGKRSYGHYGKYLDIVAPGNQITTTDLTGSDGYSKGNWGSNPDYTEDFAGTSAACPIAAGSVALIKEANPNLSWDEIYNIIKETATKVGGYEYDGKGFNIYYGYGLINARDAVQEALLKIKHCDTTNPCPTTMECNNNGICEPKKECKIDTDCTNKKCIQGYCISTIEKKNYTCKQITACVSGCGQNDSDCQQLCMFQGTSEASTEFIAMEQCFYNNCKNLSGIDFQKCTEDKCYDHLVKCLEYPPYGTKTCKEIFNCFDNCSDENCKDKCINDGTKTSKPQFQALRDCVHKKIFDEVSSEILDEIYEECNQEATQCLGKKTETPDETQDETEIQDTNTNNDSKIIDTFENETSDNDILQPPDTNNKPTSNSKTSNSGCSCSILSVL
jgi:thermitase